MKPSIRILTGLLIALLLLEAGAQESRQREYALLQKNLNFYRDGNYDQAEQNFAIVVDRLPNSPYLTANYLLLARSRYKLQKYSAALEIARRFIDRFPKSAYLDDILYTMGNTYYRLNRVETAVKTWLSAIPRSDDSRLTARLGELSRRAIRFNLEPADVQRIREEIKSDDGLMTIDIAMAEIDLARGARDQANRKLNKALTTYSTSQFGDLARQLLHTGKVQEENDDLTIALLLPLSGMNENIGKEIREGLVFGHDQAAKQNNNIKLVEYDYGHDITRALKIYRQIARDPSVIAVVGPLENDIAAACAALSAYEKLPVISPTATSAEIRDLSSYFYQLNPSLAHRAEKLARYAADSLKIRRFATFAPLDDHFIKMVDAFSESVAAAGAEVISQEWYYPGDQDFNKQFMQLKRKGLRYAFADSLLLLDTTLTDAHIDSIYREFQEAEKERMEEENIKIDSADIPIHTIGGVFVPIYEEDFQYMAPQVAYSNVQAQFLGNGDWYSPEQLNKNKNYINGIIFVSDGYINEENWDYKNLKIEYRSQKNTTPTKYNLIGYDTYLFLKQVLNSGTVANRTTFTRNLEQIQSSTGIYRHIEMDFQHGNTNSRLLKYDYGQIIPLE